MLSLFNYAELPSISDDTTEDPYDHNSPPAKSKCITNSLYKIIAVTILWLSGLAVGVFIGKSRGPPEYRSATESTPAQAAFNKLIPQVPLANMVQSVHHDPSFEAPPPPTGPEPVWDALIPDGLGYVVHPTLTPGMSIIGVFHQLHCLYIIRRAYYGNTTASPADEHPRREDFDVGVDRHPHVGHCFDYLRQSLQCASDSSLEPATERVVGNSDWGFRRQCRDYEEIKAFASRWAAVDIPGSFVPDLLGHHPE